MYIYKKKILRKFLRMVNGKIITVKKDIVDLISRHSFTIQRINDDEIFLKIDDENGIKFEKTSKGAILKLKDSKGIEHYRYLIFPCGILLLRVKTTRGDIFYFTHSLVFERVSSIEIKRDEEKIEVTGKPGDKNVRIHLKDVVLVRKTGDNTYYIYSKNKKLERELRRKLKKKLGF
ncbi:hypothetical protein AZ270_gp67 [Acidianus tailed spindle virus]|uniref:hypothetical protein n=1 Tax=Acidianus tailed spindle virus TaxID=1797140 RepID=UPI00076F341A|nr:hypothetical protein AZ270_gp67 [Acidianus tailed spindle virus]AME30090.1 hypothetical protein ATSV_C175 [Acidianus tailed spindle virus]